MPDPLTAGLSLPAHAFEFVVVDDGSHRRSRNGQGPKAVQRAALRQKKNTGFAHAVNSGRRCLRPVSLPGQQ